MYGNGSSHIIKYNENEENIFDNRSSQLPNEVATSSKAFTFFYALNLSLGKAVL